MESQHDDLRTQDSALSWQTEPEIDVGRQAFLDERRSAAIDIATGRYPFAGVRLDRADIEWLLGTLGGGRGPVFWSIPQERTRDGVDLRGADLRGVNLSGLPLARLRGGLDASEWKAATPAQRKYSVVQLDHSNLRHIHLEGAALRGAELYAADLTEASLQESDLGFANLIWATMEGAQLQQASLEAAQLVRTDLGASRLLGADLRYAHLQGANLAGASLFRALLGHAHLQDAYLHGADLAFATLNATRAPLERDIEAPPRVYHSGTHLEGAVLDFVVAPGVDMRWAHLDGASLIVAQLEGANLSSAYLYGANLSGCFLEGADLRRAWLEGANFSDGRRQRARDAAHLEGADLREAVLAGACLRGVYLTGADLSGAHLERADLRGAYLESKQIMNDDLGFIRLGQPAFPATLPAASLNGAIVDETTALPALPRPAPTPFGTAMRRLSRVRPIGLDGT
jgi:uncharacterized protein YjbI with pentapeptide repeats